MPEIGKSLYFHIPFCSKKCPYCHFYVLPDKAPLKALLLEGLHREWQVQLPKLANEEILSVYFGGGTPFLFGPQALSTLLNWVEKLYPTLYKENKVEITLEANPEHITYEKMKAYADIGINRVSIGVQSLEESSLTLLARGHTGTQAIDAIENSAKAGISNISIDLMYDLPHQTLSSWQATLTKLKDLPITHLSLYNLTFEPHTLFFKNRKKLLPHVPESEISLHMLQMALSTLEELGLKRYEISAFAKPGFKAIHNSGYWTGRSFLGYGPSAFSYWEGKRFRNIANLTQYSAQLKEGVSPIDFEETLPFPANRNELLAIGLRLLEGVYLPDLHLSPATYETLSQLEKKGWLLLKKDWALLSEEGLLFYDSVAEELI